MNQTQIYQVLQSIQEKANRKFPGLFKKEQPDKDLLFIFDEVIKKPDIPKWKREYYRVMRKEYDKVETVVDKEVADAKNEFIEDEITKKINSGQLPPREEIAKYVQAVRSSKVANHV